MLAAVPLFGALSARLPRKQLLPAVYLFFIVNLLLFYSLFQGPSIPAWGARTFFIWVSVFNLFIVSVFWSFMADIFTNKQGKRLFALIAAGGTYGAEGAAWLGITGTEKQMKAASELIKSVADEPLCKA